MRRYIHTKDAEALRGLSACQGLRKEREGERSYDETR